jgi:alkylation response protein AidB-like acyl-CoA dehydrogenase
MDPELQAIRLGGPIALCKAQASRTFEYCAREAAQIFGGLAYTRGGQGEKVERLYRYGKIIQKKPLLVHT